MNKSLTILRRALVWILALSLAFSFAVPALAEETEEADYIKDVPYIDDGDEDHLLDLFGVSENGEKKPTIIEVHGGGFFGGTKETNTDHSKVYEAAGFTVVTPNYTHMPEGNFQTLMEEIFAVLHWVDDHADEYGFDRNNIFMSGDSAGGFTVALTALLLSTENVREMYGVTLPSYEVRAFALTCPKVNVPGDREELGQKNGFRSFAAERIESVLMDDEMMDKVDLFNLIDPATYPEVYLLTTPDDAILYDEVIEFDEYLTERGIPHELHVYESQENKLQHVFNIGNVDWAESIQANDDMVAYLKGKIQ